MHKAANSPKHIQKSGVRGNGSVRIVAGKWKKSRLQISTVEGLRPTPDRVRETVFNWLGQDLSGCCVADCFAGTGVLGLEAASRGASRVYFLERNVHLIQALNANIHRLCQDEKEKQVFSVWQGEVEQTVSRLPAAAVDLVFWDPPYQNEVYSSALKAVCGALIDGGLLYLEAGQDLREAALDRMAAFNLHLIRYMQAGQVHAHLWRKQSGLG